MSTSLALSSPNYELIYDSNNMRDQTFQEGKKLYGKDANIICPCTKKSYKMTSSFISTHLQSTKHKLWVKEQQMNHNQECGSCCDDRSKVEYLCKQNREQKVMYNNLSNAKNECDKIIERLTQKNNELNRETVILAAKYDIADESSKQIITENKNLTNLLKLKEIEVSTLLLEIEILEIKVNEFAKIMGQKSSIHQMMELNEEKIKRFTPTKLKLVIKK